MKSNNPIVNTFKSLSIFFIRMGFILILPLLTHSSEELSKEYKIKASYIYNILRHTEWPEPPRNNILKVCLLKEDLFFDFFKQLINDKTIGKNQWTITPELRTLDNLQDCHSVFFTADHIPSELVKCSCLSIGDSPSFTMFGTMVNFYREDNKVRFEINIDIAKEKSFSFDSELMGFARLLKDN